MLVRNSNKDESKSAMNRGLGSVAFIGVARWACCLSRHPRRGRKADGRYKGNIGKTPATLGYRVKQVGESENMIKVEWRGERKIKIGDALAQHQ